MKPCHNCGTHSTMRRITKNKTVRLYCLDCYHAELNKDRLQAELSRKI